jgi:hypothetical protein
MLAPTEARTFGGVLEKSRTYCSYGAGRFHSVDRFELIRFVINRGLVTRVGDPGTRGFQHRTRQENSGKCEELASHNVQTAARSLLPAFVIH